MFTPAALTAALNGDFANALIASTPGGIEAQEAAGQASMVAACHLPRRVTGFLGGTTIDFVAQRLGITLGAIVDDLFIAANLPDGWKMVPTAHSMHSDLVDDKGRRRAGIFYKAAFYDRNADMRLDCRYSYRTVYDRTQDEGPVKFEAFDVVTGAVLFSSEPAAYRDWAAQDVARKVCEAWLTEHFPQYENPFHYWD